MTSELLADEGFPGRLISPFPVQQHDLWRCPNGARVDTLHLWAKSTPRTEGFVYDGVDGIGIHRCRSHAHFVRSASIVL